jgi:hypothetical protein
VALDRPDEAVAPGNAALDIFAGLGAEPAQEEAEDLLRQTAQF